MPRFLHSGSPDRHLRGPARATRLDRRAMLALTAAVPLILAAGRAMPAGPDQAGERDFAAMIDTLLPADRAAPAGTALGIDGDLRRLASDIPNYPALLDQGVDWLRAKARDDHGTDFAGLGEADRNTLLSHGAQAQAGTLPQVFVSRIRVDAMILYHAHPASWPDLGFEGPIQPGGYPDHARPPA